MSAVSNSSARSPDGQTADIPVVSTTVSELGGFVHNLIEGREDVVGKLDLCNGGVANRCKADRKPGNSLFTERSVEDSVIAVLLVQVLGTTENSAKFDIFSK